MLGRTKFALAALYMVYDEIRSPRIKKMEYLALFFSGALVGGTMVYFLSGS